MNTTFQTSSIRLLPLPILRAVLLVVVLVAGSVPAVAPAAPASVAVGMVGLQARIVALTNVERQKRGLAPLQSDEALTRAALGHSGEMVRLDYFAHESPTVGLRTVSDRARLAGCTDVEVGENIAFYEGFTVEAAAERVVTDWMNSPGHRANILRPTYTSIGLGIVCGGGRVLISQEFSGHRLSLDPVRQTEVGGETRVRLSGRALGGARELGVFDDDVPLQRVLVDAKGRFVVEVRLRAAGVHPLHIGTLVQSGRERAAFDIVSVVTVHAGSAPRPTAR